MIRLIKNLLLHYPVSDDTISASEIDIGYIFPDLHDHKIAVDLARPKTMVTGEADMVFEKNGKGDPKTAIDNSDGAVMNVWLQHVVAKNGLGNRKAAVAGGAHPHWNFDQTRYARDCIQAASKVFQGVLQSFSMSCLISTGLSAYLL
jgi:hypothetical protein